MTRPRILIVATIGRADLLAMFEQVADLAELTFVEYADTQGAEPERYERYGRLTTWEEHRSAGSLLDAVQPDLVAMLAIGSRNQLALRCEARRRGLRTIHLEHGYRLPLSTLRSLRDQGNKTTNGGVRSRGVRSRLAGQGFFARSLVGLPPAEVTRLIRYALPSVGGTSLETLAAAANLRRPDRYVSFAPECFEFHRELDLVPAALADRTLYTGVPQFDSFRAGHAAEPDSGNAILVDHQLHNTGFLGWDADHHRRWAAGIHAAVVANGMRLVVKVHPGDRSSAWADYDDGSVEVVPSIERLAERARSARIALGIMSTLQLPLAGLEQTAMVTVEVHPQAGEVLSSRLVAAGVAHPVSSFEELRAALGEAAALHEHQRAAKAAFIERFLHRLDGRAGERLTEALLAEASPTLAAADTATG